MAKTAFQAVPDGEQKAPEGRKNQVDKNLDKAGTPLEATQLRGTFAKSICRAHDLATIREREACEDGVPCARLSECMDFANGALRYLNARKKSGPKAKP